MDTRHACRLAFRWGVTAAYAALTAWLCLMPGKQLPRLRFLAFPQSDKVVHFGLYGILAGLICWAADARCRHRRAALTALLAVTAYGVVLEVLQGMLLPGDRSFSLGDIGANMLGAAFFAGGFLRWRHLTD